AQVGRFMIEELADLPVDVDYASEFRYRNPRLGPRDVVVAISQSGETADTLAAMSEAKRKGAHVLTICNVVGSTAARQSDDVLYTRAGPEIGVASTKAFTTQLTVLYLLGLFMARLRGTLPAEEIGRRVEALRQLPGQMEKVLEQKESLETIAGHLYQHENFLYLGRGTCYPIALEGALKLKEISYIHAEGYPAGEMKHGPIALIDAKMPVVVLAPQNPVYAKTLSNIEEVKGRDGILVAVATEGDTLIPQRADYTVFIPKADSALDPILAVLPLQLLAYYAAVLRGCDVDKPRNLAKSVTVE
ncbi:MAG TPA: glutamine--fructose-6-phosphate transaminase (isomerizing), partial [Bryobacteraceae bacterium]|nr:glutamine--fructose-6-phosphate transaminase (isomerizing) [Bryobacteraceae bacterium]